MSSTENTGNVVVSVVIYETHNNVNTNFRIALKFNVVNQGFKIIDTKISKYIDGVSRYRCQHFI